MSPIFRPPEWPHPSDDYRERTWVHEILDGDEPLTEDEEGRLTRLVGGLKDYVAREIDDDSILGGGPLRYHEVRRPGYDKLVPATIATADDSARATRFLKLMAADPLRADVLCFLTVQSTTYWIRQHFPEQRVAAIQADVRRRFTVDPDDPRAAAMGFNVDRAQRRLRESKLDEQMQWLLSRHGSQTARLVGLLRTTTEDEIEAFRRAVGLGLLDYAQLTSFDQPMR